jgi:hypothetical protein
MKTAEVLKTEEDLKITEDLEQIREQYKDEFATAMLDLCKAMQKEINYNPARVRQMIMQYGPYEAATKIIEIPEYSSGFAKLWEKNALHLSVEALILEHSRLFSHEVVETCKKTLAEYGYYY